MIHEDDNSQWADLLDDLKTEGYTPLKCWSVLQFYQLRGKTTTMNKSNVEHIRYLKYCVFSPQDHRYYIKSPMAFPLDALYFYKRDEKWDSYDTALNNIHKYISDSNLFLLFSLQQVSDTTSLLERLYRAYFTTEGKLDYRLYIKILEISLKLEDYKDIGKNLTGFKTTVNIMETQIRELWQKAVPKI